MPTVRVKAFAKINLTLRVLGTRADGYHELRTTFQSLALHDTLTCTERRGPFEITCSSPDCPVDATNLVWKAADAVWRAMKRRGEPANVRVDIRKRIPLQSGLGGGSSNAAAALQALATLWRTRLADADRAAIARELGADVPYFLHGGTALGVDRGDVLFPLGDVPRLWVVLVVPPFGVSTRAAYQWWDEWAAEHPIGRVPRLRQAVRAPGLDVPDLELRNDLEAPVALRQPEIGRVVRKLREAGAVYAAMSGSGSAVFGLFDARIRAEAAASAFGRSVQVVLTSTIGRKTFARSARPVTD